MRIGQNDDLEKALFSWLKKNASKQLTSQWDSR